MRARPSRRPKEKGSLPRVLTKRRSEHTSPAYFPLSPAAIYNLHRRSLLKNKAPPIKSEALSTSLVAVFLEEVPQKLVVDFMVKLHLGSLHNRAQVSRAAVGGTALQVNVAGLDVGAEKLGGPISFLEVFKRRVDVIRQVALGGAQSFDFCNLPVQPGLEDRVHHHIGIGVGSDGSHFRSHALLVADGYAYHRAAVDGRSIQLIGSFVVRVKPAVGVDASIQNQAHIVAVR